MERSKSQGDSYRKRTKQAFLWSRILRTPFWAIYSLLPFLLFQELNGGPENPPLQIAVMIALKPMVALLSMYWCASISKRRDRLVPNILWATFLGHLPFFFFPFVKNSWFIVFSFGIYMMFHRGTIPAWMELMKLNIPGICRKKIFAKGSALSYVGDGILPFLFGPLLDTHFDLWRWIFPATALLSLFTMILQYRVQVKQAKTTIPSHPNRQAFLDKLQKPWLDAWNLMKARPDFRSFQLGFMLGGAGLVIMQPVLPAYFRGVLQLSWTEVAVALTLCKGIGYVLTSQTWANWMHRADIYRVCSLVTIVAFVFPFCLLIAKIHIAWIFIAYIVYGIMQAGSELCWNLSGPIFSKSEDSSTFSSVNVVTVGLRGCIAPFLGTFLLSQTNPSSVLVIGGILCFAATLFMAANSRKKGAMVLEQAEI